MISQVYRILGKEQLSLKKITFRFSKKFRTLKLIMKNINHDYSNDYKKKCAKLSIIEKIEITELVMFNCINYIIFFASVSV